MEARVQYGVHAVATSTALRNQGLLKFLLVLFLLSCVFDPADRLLGMKVYLFVACWGAALIPVVLGSQVHRLHGGLLIYILLFLAVPVLSIAWYWTVDGRPEFEGFQLLKGYILISLAALLYISRIDLLPALSATLSVLALLIIGVFLLVTAVPVLVAPLYLFGNATGIVYLSDRDYGSGLVLSQVYFATSPMLAISIPFYFQRACTAVGSRQRLLNLLLLLAGVVAMFLAGSRNNMAVAILLPLILYVLYSRNKAFSVAAIIIAFFAFALVFVEQIAVLLDPAEFSNNIKLGLLDDYRRIFERASMLFFGSGLGAYDYWDAKGTHFFVSELTYLEVLRNFGVLGGAVMIGLLLLPIAYAVFRGRDYQDWHIILGYASYLVMCASNPNLFSSMGILILSVLMSDVFMEEAAHDSEVIGQVRSGQAVVG